jgi:PAB-dependent poly(A)-specific ribonuclease subunit 3
VVQNSIDAFAADRRRLENKDTLCRNILIYGNCRYEDQGCTFNHDQNKTSSAQGDL